MAKFQLLQKVEYSFFNAEKPYTIPDTSIFGFQTSGCIHLPDNDLVSGIITSIETKEIYDFDNNETYTQITYDLRVPNDSRDYDNIPEDKLLPIK